MASDPISIDTPNGVVSGLIDAPADPFAALVLAHGAGAGMGHPFMRDLALALAERGVAVLRYQFPYLENKQHRPDSPAVAAATVRAAAIVARAEWSLVPLFAGGKSFGGRMSSTAASMNLLPDVSGLVFFGFPLHPPKRPAITRAEHLDEVGVPMLFLQGTRDELGELDLMRGVTDRLGAKATLHVIQEANHAFAVPKRTGKTAADIIVDMASEAVKWMGGVAPGR